MKRLISLLFCILFMHPLLLRSQNTEKKVITNDFYSFSIPSHWVPVNGSAGDGTAPLKLDVGPYNLYNLQWHSPFTSMEAFKKSVSVFIQSYERKDGKELSIKEIEEQFVIIKPDGKHIKRWTQTDVSESSGEKRYIVLKTNLSITAGATEYRESRTFYLLRKTGNMIHVVEISMAEEAYNHSNRLLVDEILQSFVIK